MQSKDCLQCGKEFSKKVTTSQKTWDTRTWYCSHPCYGEARKGNSKYPAYWKGKRIPIEVCERISLTNKAKGIEPKVKSVRRGAANNRWKGGITPINHAIRTSAEYKAWRKSVFERDNYICQHCSQRGGELQADHIKPFSTHPELRFEMSNGRTLCKPCHLKTDTWGSHSFTSILVTV